MQLPIRWAFMCMNGWGLIRVQQGAELGAFGPYTTLRTEWAAQDLANSRRALAELRSGRTAPATVSLGAAGGPGGYDFPAWAQAAAAARAVAFALRRDAVLEESISTQALHWCNFDSPDQAGGSCRSGTWLGAALARLAASNNRPGGDGLPPERCLPYDPLAGPAGGARAACVPRVSGQGCGGRRPAYSDGSFAFFDLLEQWEVQRHLRNHGGVITRVDLTPEFMAFFNATPRGVLTSAPPARGKVEQHAVVIVGYDNIEGWWRVRNSWGVDWGDGGYFRIGYTAAFSLGMLSPGDTFGLTWTPRQQPQAPRLERHEVWGACGWYTARPAGEWLADVGYKFKASHGGANLRC
ncbi:hypothetical protein MNEG_2713 [Monoraphidium neglectum]|uniref:Peptidase C1A papain C-terminal domain-containing protein n=1 Tax=Monoraphidium neglectum TaxID=145388 RepID=A0A0D2MY26_9CHLO|nr:hypothetical protein MNEG_2713 [Monoraphidium neglectum]KIZ05247.1 hypothetical protein MNEG_2713 [Monoraphidium neglectum]|eukprot:XP_013904266.1 hypothetical protein MNEG_2713 [Monoraphidium neglectum]